MSKLLCTIPFAGFYNSWHDSACDDALNMALSDSSGFENAGLIERAHRDHSPDFANWREQYARAYAESFRDELADQSGVTLDSMEFESMESPREYNFDTDRIYVTIERAQLRKLYMATGTPAVEKAAADRFTSRSGFISHYSPDLAQWGILADWDHNQAGTIFNAAADQFLARDSDTGFSQSDQFDLMESYQGNGYFDDWLCENSPAFARLANVASYLRERDGRRYRTAA